ncbi:MAG: hypothetical protein AB7O62_23360 [Pirellulales bacterium]
MNRTKCHSVAICLFLLGIGGTAARADDFRIHTELFVEDEKKPAAEYTTLFKSGLVYDYRTNPPQVTIFDPARSRFILLDTQRKLRTEKSTADIETFVERLQTWAANHPDPALQFQAQPAFQETVDQETGELVFSSDWTTYRIKAEAAANPEAFRQYAAFSDWFARLNVLTGSTVLPFPRLRVNQSLAEQELVPTEVRLTVVGPNQIPTARVQSKYRTQHHVVWALSAADKRRLEQTAQDLVTFEEVKFEDYRKDELEKTAQQSKKNAGK